MKPITETNFKISLGSIVRDLITGFEGVVISRSQWLNNCNTYGVKPQELKNGKPLDTQWFDEPQLKLVRKDAFKANQSTGGPTDTPKQTNRN